MVCYSMHTSIIRKLYAISVWLVEVHVSFTPLALLLTLDTRPKRWKEQVWSRNSVGLKPRARPAVTPVERSADMAKETKAQQKTVERVMDEFKHGELKTSAGDKVTLIKKGH